MSVYALPLARASGEERVEYLQRVLIWTTLGLVLSAITGTLTAVGLYLAMGMGITLVFNQWFSLMVILGSYAVAHYVAPKMVFGQAKVLGFGVGAVFQGISMGYLLLYAVLMGMDMGNPFGLVGGALGLTALTGGGLAAYVRTGPKEFGWLGAGLSALFLPMLVLMGVGFVFPAMFGGFFGIVIAAVFVAISAAGLLYQINVVMHRLDTNQHIEGSYLIMMGVLVLFWNILSLIMRLTSRD